MNKKNNTGVIIFLVVLVILMGAYLVYDKVLNKSALVKCRDDNYNEVLDVSKLREISSADYNIIKDEYNSNYSFKLDINGKVNINFDREIENIDNAKDIIFFKADDANTPLYILTSDGEVYKYSTSDYENGKYSATKASEYSNIKRMLTYETRRKNAGGCDYIVLVDKDDNYYTLDSVCH